MTELSICEHCKGAPKLLGQENSLTVDQVYNTIRVMNYSMWEEPACVYVRMQYCPMCGRKLKPLNEL